MKIQVLDVKASTKTSAAGKAYQNVEIAYKNIDQGKVESKNITQYSKVFKAVADATTTMFYDVAISKDDKGYWQWDSFVAGTPAESPNVPTSFQPVPGKSTVAPKSNYETSEERAKRQVFIVKQSSLGHAIELMSVGAKAPPDVDAVIALAQKFTDFVFAESKAELFDMPNDLEVE